jgi:hypothetical protein
MSSIRTSATAQGGFVLADFTNHKTTGILMASRDKAPKVETIALSALLLISDTPHIT